ncbi:MAG: tetratricopeptide repeat protein, partial [Deltaproteobacteria bacterium]|nr:tetratricopeptide repeat protein [Deltaproteobacteria bacterium]
MKGTIVKGLSLLLAGMLFLATVEAYGASSTAHYLQGNSYFTKKKYDRAIEKYEKAIEVNPQVADYYYKLAETYRLKESGDEAIACYREAIEIDPQYYEAYAGLGEIFFQKGECGEAVQYYKKAIETCPTDSKDQFFFGRICDIQGDTDGAIKEYEKAIDIRSGYFDALANLAVCYAKKANYKKAVLYYVKARKIRPYDEKIVVGLGIAYTNLKEFAKARDIL